MRNDGRGVRLRQAILGMGSRPPINERLASPADGGAPDHAAILASIGEVPYEWRLDDDTLVWGANVGEVLMVGDSRAVETGRGFAQLLTPDNPVTRFDAITQGTARDDGGGVGYQLQYALKGPSGKPFWVEDTGRWFAGPDGRPRLAHGVVRVINERHAQEERLSYLSKYDALTGEMNRWHLTDVLARTLEDAIRSRSSCGFMLIAIDHLTRFNDAFGFDVADEVISAVAKRIRAKLRGADSLGRFSGNKFGVVLRSCTTEEMTVAAERLLSGMRDDTVQTAAGPVAVTITIGGVIAPRQAREPQDVLARAQETLAAARGKRPGSFQHYRPSVEREALRREAVRATDEIVDALNERRITLAFEPVVDTVGRQPVFHECLMRIRRSDGTFVSAGSIIPIAERLGLIRLLDHRVLELAMEELLAFPNLQLSLNVSPASTVEPDWWASLGAYLRAHAGVGERLTVEITEMAEIHDIDETRGFVSRVKDLGCRIAMDDFGAGYTSFRNLRKLGVDIIKIDGAFVQNLTRSEDDRVFVQTMVGLAQALGLKTVAEWVQNEEAAAKLAEWGCDCLQGALIGLASPERPWANPPTGKAHVGAV